MRRGFESECSTVPILHFMAILDVMKKIIEILALPIYNDYSWDDAVIRQRETEGWAVASTLGNVIDITAPWTIFKQPIDQIAFVKPDEISIAPTGFIFIDVLWVRRGMRKETESETSFTAFDCERGMSAYVDLDEKDLGKALQFEWRSFNEGLPGHDVISFVCSHV